MSGAALLAHDLKNALGSLEAALAALAQVPEPAAAAAAHRQCQALRRRLVAWLALYGGDRLVAWPGDEGPREFLQHLAARAEPPVAAVQVDVGTPACWTFDPRLVTLALDAALHNAQHFARHQVTLGASGQGGRLVFWVEDDGPGLGSGATALGTGLGTALCREVAAAHGAGGEVRLFNRAEGGARFELILP